MPTVRQKQAFDKLTEKHGAISIGEAMLQAGYDEDTAKKPKNLTESKGWQELMQTYLPDEKLVQAHEELLNASSVDHMVFPLDMSDEDITDLLKKANCIVKRFMHSETQTHVWYFAADNQARLKALDTAYKLKGSYAPDKSINLNVNADIKQDPKARAIGEKYEAELLNTLASETE